MPSYEQVRAMRIEENKARMKDLKIPTLAYESMQMKKGHRKESNKVTPPDQVRAEHGQSKDGEPTYSVEDLAARNRKCRTLRPRSTRVVAVSEEPTMSMVDLAKMQAEARKCKLEPCSGKNVGNDITQPKRKAGMSVEAVPSQINASLTTARGIALQGQNKEARGRENSKVMQSKMLVALGSLNAYVKMKEKLREQRREKQKVGLMSEQDVMMMSQKEVVMSQNLMMTDCAVEKNRGQQMMEADDLPPILRQHLYYGTNMWTVLRTVRDHFYHFVTWNIFF